MPIKDMTNKKFGRWTVTGLCTVTKQPAAYWVCECECGTIKSVNGQSLREGRSISCGCYIKENKYLCGLHNVTHGMKRKGKATPEYMAWHSMKGRCDNPNVLGYKDYGARGISYHHSWKSFEQFFADVGPRPSPEHSLDRKNNNGNYEPGNVRWATGFEQGRNKRNNHIVTAFGKTGPLSSFFENGSYCPKYDLALMRINKSGWDAEAAISLPPIDSRFH